MKHVLAWPKLQAEGLLDRQTQYAQRHIERAEHQRRPDHQEHRATPPRHERDSQQGHAPHDMQQIVARVVGPDCCRDAQSVEQ
jgi:hypothetical protein